MENGGAGAFLTVPIGAPARTSWAWSRARPWWMRSDMKRQPTAPSGPFRDLPRARWS